ncbi:MAG: prolyl oligopeptidase family serine peptidase [Melioribacter sp.]|nr:prolyl oligopeptidase family serine peptidase [Melioribacter sp.]
MKKIFVIIFLVISIKVFSQQYSKIWKDINYADDQKIYHMLDIYLPNSNKATYPPVIAIYGSAWFSNNSKELAFQVFGSSLLKANFAVVTPNHRSSYDAKFPAQINDVKAVIRFIRANAQKYQLDTSFIGITGFSSGGHLAALAGTTSNIKEFTIGDITFDIEGKIGNYLSYRSSVDAVVDWFGPTDFLKMDSCSSGGTIDHNSPTAPEAVLIGGPVKQNKNKCELANPITYVDPKDPPFLILHGDKDPLVPYCQSELLFKELQKNNVESQFILVSGGEHGPGLFEEKYFNMMTEFFLGQMKKIKTSIKESYIKDKKSYLRNYPNPFNGTTKISFSLHEDSNTKIIIYDLLGREISTLLNCNLRAGDYTVEWNSQSQISGIYFCKLLTNKFTDVRKMIILK